MNATDPNRRYVGLSKLLKTWRLLSALPARFQQLVWRRVRQAVFYRAVKRHSARAEAKK